LTALVFVHAEQTVNVGFAAASAGLAAARADGWLQHASASAYDAGLADGAGAAGLAGEASDVRDAGGAEAAVSAGLARVGPRGDVPLLSKLVQVYVMDVRAQDGGAALALRWEATGYGGDLFPALDADITLTPAGEGASLLTLDGAYRPPLGALGAALDSMILHRVATSTARSLLSQIAASIAEHTRRSP
jgi:hypothetical protein